eukprot:CAMPEP_0195520510 /NCGR_PEP_ID=MMETSP0794_2-20130614/17075_1 /TAXON_ID=515487 /ORGANISM="Stephanopyxis turris, Strain CCMP 815" /LENGTH=209 /DNA_ID=CAMNT_0040649887 /DNA_START=49 /DNA_END=678 /DNA_ORIENTATION=+
MNLKQTRLTIVALCAMAMIFFLISNIERDTTEADSAETTTKSVDLLEALEANDTKKVKSLIKGGVDVNEEDDVGITPLIRATLGGNVDILRLLMEAGAPAQPNPGFRHTPLRAACLTGNVELIRLLLEKGADPNAKSAGDRTPLMGACFLRPGIDPDKSAPALKAMLADPRTDPTIANKNGETALTLCQQKGYTESIGLLENALAQRIR